MNNQNEIPREDPEVLNEYYTIDDLDLTHIQKMQVLCWLARKLWVVAEMSSGDPDFYGKMYDPLSFWEGEVHSYVFSMGDGGRHHKYRDLSHVEDMLMEETIGDIASNSREE